MARQRLELEVPGQTGDVREGSLDGLGDLVDALDDLEVVDEGDVAHEDLRNSRNRGRVVGDGGLVDLVEQLGLHLEEGLERGVLASRDGIDQPEEDLTLALAGQEVLDGQSSISLEAVGVVCELLELGQDIVALALGDDDETAIDLLAVLEGGELDVGDDAKVVAAALEGLEEVGVLILVGVDDLARCQDDLEVENCVGNEATLSREPGVATAKG